jgi:hypothetical protein
MTDTKTADGPETKRCHVIFHSSEEAVFPDVGISIGLGNGKALWIGEVHSDTICEHGFNVSDFGGDGWWLCNYADLDPIAKFIDADRAREFSETLEAALKYEEPDNAVY